MKPLPLGVLATLAFAGAAQAGAPEDLTAELRSACRAGPLPRVSGVSEREHGVIKADDVRVALDETYPVSRLLYLRPAPPKDPLLEPQRAKESQLSPAQWLAKRAFNPPAAPAKEDATLLDVKRLVESWAGSGQGLPLEVGGLRIVAPGLDQEEVLARLLAGDQTGMDIVCRWPVAEPKERDPSAGAFRLVRTPEDLDKPKIKDRKFAEFSYADDRQTRVQSWGVVATAALEWNEVPLGGQDGYLHISPSVYVAYERKGENDPTADGYVNNLKFGARASGDLGFGSDWFAYYSVAGTIETDDDFESEAYALEVRLDPPLPRLPYHRLEQGIGSGRNVTASAIWNVDLVADWVQVDDAGRKSALKDAAEYVRLGYDAGFTIRVGPTRLASGKEPWRVALVTSYQVRDGQTNDGGDAQLFASALQFEHSETTNLAFGLSYERGENLTSFESSELWKLFLGLRF